MKISLRDVELSQLNNTSLTLVAKYARLLKASEGVELKLQDKDILVNISKSARSTENEELITLYRHLKKEVRIGVFESLKDWDFKLVKVKC